MRIFCFLQIKPIDQVIFSSRFQVLFKQKGYLVFDADNHSDQYLMEQGKELFSKASEIVIHIEVSGSESLGSLKRLFEVLRKLRIKTIYQLDGEHLQLNQMLKFLKAERSINLESYLNSKSSASK